MRKNRLMKAGYILFVVALVVWTVFGMWNGVRGTGELVLLIRSGRLVDAQVTGYEPEPKNTRMGYVHYAFNAGSRAIDNRFPYPVSRYGDYPIGVAVPVTYLPDQPHVVRMGQVGMARLGTTLLSSFLFIIAGFIGFGLPIIALKANLANAQEPAAA